MEWNAWSGDPDSRCISRKEEQFRRSYNNKSLLDSVCVYGTSKYIFPPANRDQIRDGSRGDYVIRYIFQPCPFELLHGPSFCPSIHPSILHDSSNSSHKVNFVVSCCLLSCRLVCDLLNRLKLKISSIMGKKRRGPTLEELLARPWCYYCERDFDDIKILMLHQKAKHFKCERCGRRLNTAGG